MVTGDRLRDREREVAAIRALLDGARPRRWRRAVDRCGVADLRSQGGPQGALSSGSHAGRGDEPMAPPHARDARAVRRLGRRPGPADAERLHQDRPRRLGRRRRHRRLVVRVREDLRVVRRGPRRRPARRAAGDRLGRRRRSACSRRSPPPRRACSCSWCCSSPGSRLDLDAGGRAHRAARLPARAARPRAQHPAVRHPRGRPRRGRAAALARAHVELALEPRGGRRRHDRDRAAALVLAARARLRDRGAAPRTGRRSTRRATATSGC